VTARRTLQAATSGKSIELDRWLITLAGLGADERRPVITHMQPTAERADRQRAHPARRSRAHGDRLMGHLLDRLHENIGFLELNLHTLWSLIRVRPEMIRVISAAEELQAKLERLLEENLVSAAALRELDALRYGIAMARRY
jgi:hypothetical protein